MHQRGVSRFNLVEARDLVLDGPARSCDSQHVADGEVTLRPPEPHDIPDPSPRERLLLRRQRRDFGGGKRTVEDQSSVQQRALR